MTTITVPRETWDGMLSALENHPGNYKLTSLESKVYQSIIDKAEALAASKPTQVSLQWLAEMIMSDCGCSTNNERLLERIISRIEQYERANTLQPNDIEDPVTVPRALLGAACAAIDRKSDAPKTLQMLRVYTMQSTP